MFDSCLWTCFIWYLFATAGYHLDTLLDTLEEGRHSFLDFSTFPDLLKSSNPPLSAMRNCPDVRQATAKANIMELSIRSVPATGKRQRRQSSCTRAVSESFSERLFCFVRVEKTGHERFV